MRLWRKRENGKKTHPGLYINGERAFTSIPAQAGIQERRELTL